MIVILFLTLIASFYEVLILWQGWGWFAVPLGAVEVGYWTLFALVTLLATALSKVGEVRQWHTPLGVDEDLVRTCLMHRLATLGGIHAVLATIWYFS